MAFSETEFETPIQAGAVLNAHHLILFSLTCYKFRDRALLVIFIDLTQRTTTHICEATELISSELFHRE